jgi:hypothetical protein
VTGWTQLRVLTDAERNPGDLFDPARPYQEGAVTAIGLMRHGTSEGNAAVLITVTLPDGSQAVGQTTWRLFNNAARALAVSPIASEEVQGP